MRKILIVGGGYAGFYTAWGLEKKLRRDEAEVTLVDPRGYMTYQPFLPEVAAGSIEARHVAVSLRGHLRRTAIVAGHVTEIDHARRTATVRTIEGERREIRYDVIVVTAGAVTRTFPVPGVADVAIGFKHVEEAVAVRDLLLTAFERAATLPPGPERDELLAVTVVGGGFTGVEVFSELLALATSLLRSYPELSFSDLSFHLVQAGDRILPEVTDRPGAWVTRHLEQRGAHLHVSTQVESAEGGRVVLSTGESYAGKILVWAAGNGSNPVVAQHTDLPIDERGLLQVRADLRVGTDEHPVRTRGVPATTPPCPTSPPPCRAPSPSPTRSMPCVRAGCWPGTSWRTCVAGPRDGTSTTRWGPSRRSGSGRGSSSTTASSSPAPWRGSCTAAITCWRSRRGSGRSA